jgi:ketosteroid isomerase-like protein
MRDMNLGEGVIRARVDEWAQAVCAKDIDRVMSLYASDIVSFDLDPPLRYAGTEDKRQAWQKLFAAYAGALGYEVHELEVTVHGDLAFVHGLNHVSGKLVGGQAVEMWVRWTGCFRRVDDVWLIAHDHVSVPADLARGRAVVDIQP